MSEVVVLKIIFTQDDDSETETLHTEVVPAFEDPFMYGMALVDAMRTVASAYADMEGGDIPHYLERVRAGFDAEWEKKSSEIFMQSKTKLDG